MEEIKRAGVLTFTMLWRLIRCALTACLLSLWGVGQTLFGGHYQEMAIKVGAEARSIKFQGSLQSFLHCLRILSIISLKKSALNFSTLIQSSQGSSFYVRENTEAVSFTKPFGIAYCRYLLAAETASVSTPQERMLPASQHCLPNPLKHHVCSAEISPPEATTMDLLL